jgi:hypothetical protein
MPTAPNTYVRIMRIADGRGLTAAAALVTMSSFLDRRIA